MMTQRLSSHPVREFAAWMVLLFFLAFVGSAGAAAIPLPGKLLPEDTLFMVTVPNFAKLRKVCQRAPMARLWEDPAMKPFRDHFVSKCKTELIGPLQHELGLKLGAFADLPQGQLTFAITQNGWPSAKGRSPGLLLLVDTKSHSGQLKTNLTDLRKKWVEAGNPIKAERIHGVQFSVLPLSSNGIPKTLQKFFPQAQQTFSSEDSHDKDARSLVIGQYEALLIVANSTKVVENVMVHLTGGAMPSLKDLAAYEADRLALFRKAPLYGWGNVKSLLNLLTRPTDLQTDPNTPDPLAFLDPDHILAAIGFNSLQTLAFNFQNTRGGTSFQLFLGAPEARRRGIFRLFPSEPKPAGPPGFVPADVEKFERCRINGQKAWATLKQILNNISPQWLTSLNFILNTANAAAQQRDPNFDIEKNLFGNLGDDFITYEKAPGGRNSAQSKAPPSLLLIGSPHPKELAASLKSLLVLMSAQAATPKERDFLGRKIYSVPLPSLPFLGGGAAGGSAPRTLNYAASDGYVAITTDDSMLEAYLRSTDSQPNKLREKAGLVAAAAKIGGMNTGWFGYENDTETMRAWFEAMRKNSAATNHTQPVLPPGFAPFGAAESGFKDWMDYALLPPFDQVAKYFSFTVYTLSEKTAGLSFKWFMPEPPRLEKAALDN